MRPENVDILQDTLHCLKTGYYQTGSQSVKLKLTKKEMKSISVYLPEEIETLRHRGPRVFENDGTPLHLDCVNADAFTLAIECKKQDRDSRVLVLNLANPVHPGGGVRKGARAQEEDLCRRSSLLVSLESDEARRYYGYNSSLHTYMGSDAVMVTEQVEVFKDERGSGMKESEIVSVITCAAPMITYGKEGMSEEEYRTLVRRRIEGILLVAQKRGYKSLILGAFGCGAFRNDAKVVSEQFFLAIRNVGAGYFDRIWFAVRDHSESRYNYRSFAEWFLNRYWSSGIRISEGNVTFFWMPDEENGFFSNWNPDPFVVDDFIYLHMEQYMMAQKAKVFHDAKRYTAILKATTARECKELGRLVSPFDSERWKEVRAEIVKRGLREKFSQNPELKKALLATGDSVLAEASPYDQVWGIGLDRESALKVPKENWPGENLLGRLLGELREEFRRGE